MSYTYDLSSSRARELFKEWAYREMEKKHLSEKLGKSNPENLARWLIDKAQSEQSVDLKAKGSVKLATGDRLGQNIEPNSGFVSSWDEAKDIASSVAKEVRDNNEHVW